MRLKASNLRVSAAARSAAGWICSTSLGRGFLRCGRAGQTMREHLGVAFHHHQQVVEIVGDATGELSDCLHFLRLTQLVGRVLAVGDIECDANHSYDFAIGAS